MNVIPNNIQAKEFRYRAECRDQLQHKGDLYVGTGTTEEVTLDDGTKKNVQVTEPLYRTTDGSAPASDDSNQPTNGMALLIDNSNSKGWKVGKVGPEGLDERYYVYNEQINFAAGIRGILNGITWSQIINPNQPSSSLKLMPTKITSLNTSKTLVLPFENGTLATKEQIESGEIVAKTAQNATNATNAQKLAFFEQGWTELNGGILDQRDTNTDIVGTWSLPRENGMDAVFLRLDIEDPHGVITTMGFWVPIMPSAASELPTTAVSPVLSLSGKNDTSILCQCWINSLVNSALVTLRVIDSNIASFYFGQDKYSYKMYYEAYIE